MVFDLVRSVILDISLFLKVACKSSMFPFLVVYILEDSQVHISFMYSCDIITDIKTPINKAFSFYTTLNIPYINLDNHHVRFRWHFDNSWFESKRYIIENVHRFDSIILELTGMLVFSII